MSATTGAILTSASAQDEFNMANASSLRAIEGPRHDGGDMNEKQVPYSCCISRSSSPQLLDEARRSGEEAGFRAVMCRADQHTCAPVCTVVHGPTRSTQNGGRARSRPHEGGRDVDYQLKMKQ